MGEVGPHRAGEDVWKEQKGERIYAMQRKPRKHKMKKYMDKEKYKNGDRPSLHTVVVTETTPYAATEAHVSSREEKLSL